MDMQGWVELGAAVLAGWAVWKTLPRPVARDWERLFKVSLSALAWGEAEAAGGSEAARTARWSASLAAGVPYHPAGRQPEVKLADPRPDALPTPALDGERALVEALAGVEGAPARWRRMYVDDPRAVDALGEDPTLLGPAYDPARLVGAGVDWEAIAAWSPAVAPALLRRLAHHRLVLLPGAAPGPVAAAELEAAVPGLAVHTLPAGEDATATATAADPSPGALLACCTTPADRLLVLAGPGRVPGLLRALRESEALRDRTIAVVSLGGPVARDAADAAWLAAEFRHDRMEPELQRTTGFLAIIDADPADPLAADWAGARFPDPPLRDGERATIAAVDLGPLPLAAQPPGRLARALLVLLAAWLSG